MPGLARFEISPISTALLETQASIYDKYLRYQTDCIEDTLAAGKVR